jgi:hypothetical protein
VTRRPAILLVLALVAALLGATAATAGAPPRSRPVPHIPQPTGYAFKTVNGKLRVEETDRVTPPGGGSYTNKIVTLFEAKRSPIPAGIINLKRGSRSKVHIAATATVTGTETQIRSDGTTDPCSGGRSRTLRSAIDIEFRATEAAVKSSWTIPDYYFNGQCGRAWGFDGATGHESNPKGLYKRLKPVLTVGGQRVLSEAPGGYAHQTLEWKGTVTLKRYQAPGT